MPGIARKLIICAAVDGLLLQPVGLKSSERGGVRIEYGTNTVTSVSSDGGIGTGLEAYGIIGLLNLFSSSYLISITHREHVAQIRDHPIFAIKDVTLIPLSSRIDAEKAISAAQKSLKHSDGLQDFVSDDETDPGTPRASLQEQRENDASALDPQAKPSSDGPITKGVIQNVGMYGRFAEKWFKRHDDTEKSHEAGQSMSPGNLTIEQERQAERLLPQGSDASEADEDEPTKAPKATKSNKKALELASPKPKSAIESLTPRILRTARLYFSTSGFYFSYDHNLSERLCRSSGKPSSAPLWKQFDTLYFWNKQLLRPLMDQGHDQFILPIIQGFVGQRAFSIAEPDKERAVSDPRESKMESIELTDRKAIMIEKPAASPQNFLLTLISRRSVKRAGLRYLRRGVDDEGAVANNVETEQILSVNTWLDSDKIFSLVQVRGSIPIFFSQSPYSFKPIPLMFGSVATNQAAFKKHFSLLAERYGDVQATSLIDKHGTEVKIGEAYESYAKSLNEYGGIDGKLLNFEWFDFHGVCKGMKFEKVSVLLNALEGRLDSFGWSIQQDGEVSRAQSGVLRTNCMDCLDRTNVVQSAVAGRALQQQLAELGLSVDLQNDPTTQWFNTLWADNGDAISKQYAGTSALKGDFTRTRKRNWTGALSDFSLTLNRYYNNIFGDYFLQTCIDYYLGNAGPVAFDEFETDMKIRDYGLDMNRLRETAIETSRKVVVEGAAEDFVAGWILNCPQEANTLRSAQFEDCVLLLTKTTLYFCRFDWNTDKVGSFEKIDLLNITEMWRGAYVTSALGQTHLDETLNVGFALRFEIKGPEVIRTNTRSLRNEESVESVTAPEKGIESSVSPLPNSGRLLAFKALRNSVAGENTRQESVPKTEGQAIKDISDQIHNAITNAFNSQVTAETVPARTQAPELEERDLISAAEAKKSTKYVESIGYALKKLVWS